MMGFDLLLALAGVLAAGAVVLALIALRRACWACRPPRQRNIVAIGEPVELDRPPR